jgi:hypothetical protein
MSKKESHRKQSDRDMVLWKAIQSSAKEIARIDADSDGRVLVIGEIGVPLNEEAWPLDAVESVQADVRRLMILAVFAGYQMALHERAADLMLMPSGAKEAAEKHAGWLRWWAENDEMSKRFRRLMKMARIDPTDAFGARALDDGE